MQSCPKPFHKGGLYSYLLGENPPTSGQSYPVGFQYWVDTYYWFMQHVALASCVNLCLGHAQDKIFIATVGRISRCPPPA